MKNDPLATFRRGIHALVKMEDRDLSVRQMAVLLHLAELPDVAPSVRPLAEMFNVSKPTISRAMDRLVEMGLVGCTQDPIDRRKIRAVITRAGIAYVKKLEAELSA